MVLENPKQRNITFSNFTREAKTLSNNNYFQIINNKTLFFGHKNLKIGRDMINNLTNHIQSKTQF